LQRYDLAAGRVGFDPPARCFNFGQLWHGLAWVAPGGTKQKSPARPGFFL
jgi:hypothetical protein